MVSLKDRIDLILESRGMKQIQFAKELGISTAYVNGIHKGKNRNISKPLAKLISLKFGVNEQWVLDGTGPMEPEDGGNSSSSMREQEILIYARQEAIEILLKSAEAEMQQLRKELTGRK